MVRKKVERFMATNETILYVLTGLLIIREAMFQVALQKLVNKVMSRDFHDYSFHNASKKDTPKKKGVELDLNQYHSVDDVNKIVIG